MSESPSKDTLPPKDTAESGPDAAAAPSEAAPPPSTTTADLTPSVPEVPNDEEPGAVTDTPDRPTDASPPADAAEDSTAPAPPPKPTIDTSSTKPVAPRGMPIETDSQASLQEVALSRSGTPADVSASAAPSAPGSATESRRTSQPTGITSPSIGSSPSRPGSASMSPRPSSRPTHPSAHSRRSSTATTLSLSSFPQNARSPANGGSSTSQLSTVLIIPPLQVLVQSKEAKKSASFMAAAQKALDLCQASERGDASAAYLHPREIFEPLRLAISNPQTTSVPILITSLDLLSKLISHSFFSEPNGPPRGMSPLPDLITHTISLSYSEASPPQVALQVVKALMAIVLSTDHGMLVHQSSLLKAIKTVYNVFLLSNDPANQVVAQGGLTQMVHHVFGRVPRPDTRSEAVTPRKSENEARRLSSLHRDATPDIHRQEAATPILEGAPKLTLSVVTIHSKSGADAGSSDSFSQPNPNDEIPTAPAQIGADARLPTPAPPDADAPQVPKNTVSIPLDQGDALATSQVAPSADMAPQDTVDEEGSTFDAMGRPIPSEELFVKDAFLVFRALCKLSMEPTLVERRAPKPQPDYSSLTSPVRKTSGLTKCGSSCCASILS